MKGRVVLFDPKPVDTFGDTIRTAVLERGWSEKRQAYAQSFDSDELDAAQLLMPILAYSS